MDIYVFSSPNKAVPVAGDKIVIGDSEDRNVDNLPKRKTATLGSILPELNGGAYISTYTEFAEANENDEIINLIFNSVEIDLGSNELEIKEGKRYFFNNTTITHTDFTKKIISAVGVDNFFITGSLVIEGTRTGTNNLLESGIYLNNCKNFEISGVVIRNCRYCGIEIQNTTPVVAQRGDRGRFSNIAILDGQFPIFLEENAEYHLFTNVTVSGNERAVVIQGGNNNFVNCNIVDNEQGVQLISGTNHAHGIFSGCNINHNQEYNLYAVGVTLGETFDGCHIYGDSIGGLGKIRLENSRGICINGGQIDAMIEVIDGISNGGNMVCNNFIAGSFTTVTGSGTGDILIKNNFDINGLSALNN